MYNQSETGRTHCVCGGDHHPGTRGGRDLLGHWTGAYAFATELPRVLHKCLKVRIVTPEVLRFEFVVRLAGIEPAAFRSGAERSVR